MGFDDAVPVHKQRQGMEDPGQDYTFSLGQAVKRGGHRSPLAASSSAAELGGTAPEPSVGPVYRSVAAASPGAIAFGFHLAVVNGPLDAIAADLGFAGNSALQGLVVSATLLGAAIGSIAGGNLAESLGRRTAFLIAAIPLTSGPLLSSLATALKPMVIGRLLAGVGIGLASALVPLYISEVSPSSIRGALGSVTQLMINVGILAALAVNVALPATAWRTMFQIAAVPALLLGIGMLLSPESPRWLVAKGRIEEAKAAASRLWGAGGISTLDLEASGGEGSPKEAAGWGDLLNSAYRHTVIIGCTLFVLQQCSGINAIVYFSSSVFKQAGIESGALASLAVGAVNLAGTLVAAGLMDTAGRKQLLTRSFMGMGASMIIMAAGLAIEALRPFSGFIAVAGTIGYILAFAMGAGPIPGLIVPELTAARIRGRAVAAAMLTHWVFNLLVGQSFLAAVNTVGVAGVYLVFGLVSLLAVAYVGKSVPETKGKTLEQIEIELSGGK